MFQYYFEPRADLLQDKNLVKRILQNLSSKEDQSVDF